MAENEKGYEIVEIKKNISPDSKQKDPFMNIDGIIQPTISFDSLILAHENSFIIGGIVEKIASTADSGFIKTENAGLDSILGDLDMRFIFENLYSCGNVFLEKVKNGGGNLAELLYFLTPSVRVKKEGDEIKYLQIVNGSQESFEKNEVVHIRLTSMRNRYYGDSKFAKAITQITLLACIDQYYENLFGNGMLGTIVLTDKSGKLTQEQREALKALIEERLAGIKSAFKTVIVPVELDRLDLDKEIDTEAFLKFRLDLIKAISIALNIPYDLLISDSSNRAASEVSMEMFNKDIVKPLQNAFIRQIRAQLRDEFGKDVDKIEFNPIDTSNQLENMKIDTGYKTAGILTANEIREKLGYEKVADGDKLEVSKNPAADNSSAADQKIQKIYEEIEKLYGDNGEG